MAPDQAAVERAESPGRLHELAMLEGERLAADDARVGDPAAHHEHEHEVDLPRPEYREEGHPEEQNGKGELDVARAHEHIVEPAPVEAAEHAQGDPRRSRDDHGDESHDQGDARAIQETAQHVAAERVGAERMGGAAARAPHGRSQTLQQIVLERIGGRQHRGEEGGGG